MTIVSPVLTDQDGGSQGTLYQIVFGILGFRGKKPTRTILSGGGSHKKIWSDELRSAMADDPRKAEIILFIMPKSHFWNTTDSFCCGGSHVGPLLVPCNRFRFLFYGVFKYIFFKLMLDQLFVSPNGHRTASFQVKWPEFCRLQATHSRNKNNGGHKKPSRYFTF